MTAMQYMSFKKVLNSFHNRGLVGWCSFILLYFGLTFSSLDFPFLSTTTITIVIVIQRKLTMKARTNRTDRRKKTKPGMSCNFHYEVVVCDDGRVNGVNILNFFLNALRILGMESKNQVVFLFEEIIFCFMYSFMYSSGQRIRN